MQHARATPPRIYAAQQKRSGPACNTTAPRHHAFTPRNKALRTGMQHHHARHLCRVEAQHRRATPTRNTGMRQLLATLTCNNSSTRVRNKTMQHLRAE
eukprot:360244-Chlamydomonas_euryale.AAC.3